MITQWIEYKYQEHQIEPYFKCYFLLTSFLVQSSLANDWPQFEIIQIISFLVWEDTL